MARFKKGTLKTGGREAGTPNKTTSEVQNALLKILYDNLDQLKIDIKSMKDKDRALLLISLAKHCTPPALNPEKLTEEQLIQIIDYLEKREHENKS
ncbi:MAG TPA: hypothetical protein VMV77_03465 [Bacteroidales bacterium]|nr:hypothetical protein [Bacteroidales bacterium]